WAASEWGEHLGDFLVVLFDRGGGPRAGKLAVSALLWALPPLGLTVRSAFPLAPQAAAGWARLRPPQSRPPIPWLVAASIAEWLFASSKPPMGLLIALLFATYCRPGGGLVLLGRQVVIKPIFGMPGVLGQVSIALHPEDLGASSKTGLVDSSAALDLPEHQWVGRALLKLKGRRAPFWRLFPISHCELPGEMKRAAVAAGCEVLRPTPDGLRRGGASRDKALGLRSWGDVQLRGKWRSPLSAQRYEKHARISEQLERLDPRVLLDLQSREGRDFLEVFAGAEHFSQALRRRGAAVMSIDARRGPRRDLRVQEVCWIFSGLVWGLWLGTPCSSFSRARRAPAGLRTPAALRSPQQPRGLSGPPPRGAAKLAEGSALADRAGQLGRLALERRIPGGAENPAQSFLWALRSRARFPAQPDVFDAIIDCCAFGRDFRARARLRLR
ncbi:unnamed protein product, partial [Prorocentrum cordatum]